MCLVNTPSIGYSPNPCVPRKTELRASESNLEQSLTPGLRIAALRAGFDGDEGRNSIADDCKTELCRLLLDQLRVLGTALQLVTELEGTAIRARFSFVARCPSARLINGQTKTPIPSHEAVGDAQA